MRYLIDRARRNGFEWRIVGRSDGKVEVWTQKGILEFSDQSSAYNHVAKSTYLIAQDFRKYNPGQTLKLDMDDGSGKDLTVIDNTQQAITMVDNDGNQYNIPHSRPEGAEHYRSEQYPPAPEPGSVVDVYAKEEDFVIIGYCERCNEEIEGTSNYTMEDHYLDVHGIEMDKEGTSPFMTPNTSTDFGGKRELYRGAMEILAYSKSYGHKCSRCGNALEEGPGGSMVCVQCGNKYPSVKQSAVEQLSLFPKRNDKEIELWIKNDKTLYTWWRESHKPIEKFIKKNQVVLNKYIDNFLEKQSAEQTGVFDTKEKESIGYLGPNTYYTAKEAKSETEIHSIADENDINISGFDMKQILIGFEEEYKEHAADKELVVAKSPADVLKIVMAHLKEEPDYYTKLKRVMGKKSIITGEYFKHKGSKKSGLFLIAEEIKFLQNELESYQDLFKSAHIVGSWATQDPNHMPDRLGRGTSDLDLMLEPRKMPAWGTPAADVAIDLEKKFKDKFGRKSHFNLEPVIGKAEYVTIWNSEVQNKKADITRTPYYCHQDHTRLMPHDPSDARKVCPDCGAVYTAKNILSARDIVAISPFDKSPVWPEGGPKIERRPYRCKDCGHEKLISTNHIGDVADYCEECSWKPSWGEHQVPMFGRTYRMFEYSGPTKNTIYSKRILSGKDIVAQPMEPSPMGQPQDTQKPLEAEPQQQHLQHPGPEGRSEVSTGRVLSRHELIQEAETLIYNALWKDVKIGTYDLTQYMSEEYGNSPEEILEAVQQAWKIVQFEKKDEELTGPGNEQSAEDVLRE